MHAAHVRVSVFARPAARLALALALALACSLAAAAGVLPAEVAAALDRARVPREAFAAVVQEAGADAAPRLEWQSAQPMNPASLTKLATTAAALDLLGPAWTWTTPVWIDGRVEGGVLDGNLVIRGSGDPKLVLERVWLLLRRVRQAGVSEIRGDIVLDRTAFSGVDGDPSEFDGDPARPYNVRADALLLNQKSVTFSFAPDAARGVARVVVEPELDGVQADATVPLGIGRAAACGDWRGALQAGLADPRAWRFAGVFPAGCGADRAWPVAYADPSSYNARLLRALWRELGGRLVGTVRDGLAPARPADIEYASPPLAEVVRDINKYSNNAMAQQLFLTLGLVQRGIGTPETAREALRGWLDARLGAAAAGSVIDNGSGLSRDTRLSAQALARLLQAAWASPTMPELMASLPVSGLDGTLRRSAAMAAPEVQGRAHLKTGSLRDVAGMAGYVHGAGGRRYVLVGLVNHPNAAAARPALDALLRWTLALPPRGAGAP